MDDRSRCIQRIENLVMTMLTQLNNGRLPPLVVPTLSNNGDLEEIMNLEDTAIYSGASGTVRHLSSPQTAQKYTQMMAIMAVVAELKATNKTLSQRDVYYSLKSMFENQQECNRVIIEVGLLLGVRRYEMGIIPTSRGYVSGNMRFRKFQPSPGTASSNDVPWIDALDADNGVPISGMWSDISQMIQIESSAICILVVEKEGVFRRLCEDNIFRKIPLILVTGCGFPDIATRALVARVSKFLNHVPVLGICDYNPSGVALLMTYKYGSVAKRFEGHGYQVEKLIWIALKASHIVEFLPETDICEPIRQQKGSLMELDAQSLSAYNITPPKIQSWDMPFNIGSGGHRLVESLTQIERRKLTLMINRLKESTHDNEVLQELQNMEKLGKKCDLESLYSMGVGFITIFIQQELVQYLPAA